MIPHELTVLKTDTVDVDIVSVMVFVASDNVRTQEHAELIRDSGNISNPGKLPTSALLFNGSPGLMV
jgi:hypothetical protein